LFRSYLYISIVVLALIVFEL